MVIEQIFLVNDDEIYALVCETQAVDYRAGDVRGEERMKSTSFPGSLILPPGTLVGSGHVLL